MKNKQYEKCENKKELFMSREIPVLVHSPEVCEHPWAHTLE